MADHQSPRRFGLIQRLRNLLGRPARRPQLTNEQKDEQLARFNEIYRQRTGRSLTQRQIQNLEQMQDADL